MRTIDYLVLSQLSYVNFTNDDTGQALGEIIEMANDANSGYEREGLNPHDSALAALRDPSNHLRSWEVLASRASDSFAATAFKNPETGEIVFSFRGTNNAVDWVADAQIGLGKPAALIPQFQLAKDFVYNTLNEHGPICYATQDEIFDSLGHHSNISFTGHSLGGGLAQCLKNLFSKMEGCCA